jgi:3-oxoacyl-[acyl-carrier-protein] synthase II
MTAPVNEAIAVSRWALHIPGFDLAELVPGVGPAPSVPPERAGELLGDRGLLAKEAATRLALCAVHRALGLEPHMRPAWESDPRTAVVASSNFGNAGTVASIAMMLHRGDEKVSPLQAPNASSNVIASTVAIWFRCGAPNLMVCSGATGGLDAAALAAVLLRADRADRVIVVGVEPDDDVASRLHALRRTAAPGERLRAGAAAVVLERASAGAHAPRLGPIRSCANPAGVVAPARADVLLGPSRLAPPGIRTVDLSHHVGDTFGACGVIQLVVAAALVAAREATSVELICGEQADGWREAVVTRGTDDAARAHRAAEAGAVTQ